MDRTQFSQIYGNTDKQVLLDRLTYLCAKGFDEFKVEALRIMGVGRLPNAPTKMLLEQCVYRNMQERVEFESRDNYYLMNAAAFICVGTPLFKKYELFVPQLPKDEAQQIANISNQLSDFVLDALLLLSTMEFHKQIPKSQLAFYGTLSKNPVKGHMSIYQAVFVLLHGQGSPNSATDVDPSFAIILLRQLIELRLRFGLGVVGAIRGGVVEPLPMKLIFEALRKFSKEVKLIVPLGTIQRVYSWCNQFVHTGQVDYIWKTHLSMDCLASLFFFPFKSQRNWNIYAGIETTAPDLDKLYDFIKHRFNSKGGFMQRLLRFAHLRNRRPVAELIRVQPECKLT